jgi:hypothetical protein
MFGIDFVRRLQRRVVLFNYPRVPFASLFPPQALMFVAFGDIQNSLVKPANKNESKTYAKKPNQ